LTTPRRVDDDCLQELRWPYDRRDLSEARRDLAAWLAKWSAKYSKLTGRVEENIEETLTFYRLPRQHPISISSRSTCWSIKRGDQAPHPRRTHLPETSHGRRSGSRSFPRSDAMCAARSA
jgi:hypothetical protein